MRYIPGVSPRPRIVNIYEEELKAEWRRQMQKLALHGWKPAYGEWLRSYENEECS